MTCLRGPASYVGRRELFFLAALLLVYLGSVARLFATDQHWTGTVNTTWGLGANWNNLAAPGSSDNAVFDGTFSNQPSVVTNTTIGGIWMTGSIGQNVTIGAGGGTLTLNGNTINGSSGLGILIDNSNAFTLTINCPLKLGAGQTWRNNSSNLLTIGGAVNTNGFGLTIDGSGSTTISSVVSGSGTLTKAGSGTLTLSGVNTYSGATSINAGVLNIQNAAALGTTAGGTTVSTGAALQIQNSISVGAEALTLNGSGISSTGALRNISGSNSISGAITLGSATTIGSDAGTLTLSGAINNGGFLLTTTGAGSLTMSGVISGTGGLTINGSGTVTLSGTNTYTGTTTVNSGVLALNNTSAINGTLVIGDNVSAAGSATVRELAANQLNGGGAITVNPSGVLDLNGFADTFNNGLTLESGDTAGASVINSGAAKLTLKSNVTLAVQGTGAVGATITGNIVDGGAIRTFTVNDGAASADLTIAAVMQGAKGYIKDGAGRLVLSAVNTNTGTFTINAGPVQLQNASAINSFSSTTVNSGGALEFTGGIAFNADPVTINGSGVSSTGAILNVSGTNSFSGAITLSSASEIDSATGALTLSGGITNGGFLLTLGGASSLTISGAITGTGGLTKEDAGTTTLSGANTYTGGTNINGGTLSLGSSGAIGSSGTISFGGGTLQYSASNTTDYSARFSTATDQAYKIDTNGQSVTFATALTSSGGSLTKLGSGTLILSAANTYTGGTTLSAGTLQLSVLGTLGSTSGSLTVNGGTLDLNGTNQTVGALSGSGGTILNNLTATNKTLTVGQGGGSGSYAGVIADHTIGTGTLALTKTGSGTQTLIGTNTFTGATTVNAGTLIAAGSSGSALGSTSSITVNSGGTLLLGASNQINNSAGMTLAGGTFAKGGYSEGTASSVGIGALTLTATGSHIDFGTGTVGVLSFASFTPSSYTITIDNWTGIPDHVGDASTDRLIFDSDQSSNLSHFTFSGYVGAEEIALGGGFYEIVPIFTPEPSTYFVATLASLGTVYFQRRRIRFHLKRFLGGSEQKITYL